MQQSCKRWRWLQSMLASSNVLTKNATHAGLWARVAPQQFIAPEELVERG